MSKEKHQKMIRTSVVQHGKLADKKMTMIFKVLAASSVLLNIHMDKNAVVMGETATPTLGWFYQLLRSQSGRALRA